MYYLKKKKAKELPKKSEFPKELLQNKTNVKPIKLEVMNPIILTSFIIPGAIAFGLIALLIKERYNLLPKKPNATQRIETKNQSNQAVREYQKDRLTLGKRYPEDFLDLSGGSMGI